METNQNIEQITAAKIEAIRRQSAYNLPDRPSERGMKPADIKAAFWKPFINTTDSLLAEVSRIIEEANAVINNIRSNASQIDIAKINYTDIINALDSSDTQKPLSAAQGKALKDIHNKHLADKDNPHAVTKTHVGLGNVDNTADTNKPISTAQQEALDKKVNYTDIVDNLSSADSEKPLSAAQGKLLREGLDSTNETLSASVRNVEYDSVAAKISFKDNAGNVVREIDLPLESMVTGIEDEYTDEGKYRVRFVLRNPDGGEPTYTDWIELDDMIKGFVKIGDIIDSLDSSDTQKPLSAAQGKALKDAQDKHLADKENPHAVTKTQVGLGNVDNTADLDKPISTAQATKFAELLKLINDLKESGLSVTIVDDLKTDNPSLPLSARQGMLLEQKKLNVADLNVTEAEVDEEGVLYFNDTHGEGVTKAQFNAELSALNDMLASIDAEISETEETLSLINDGGLE